MPLDKPRAPLSLPALPFAENALEPVISARTISFHYGKHHRAYVDKLNELIAGTAYDGLLLEEIVRKSAKSARDKAIFNNAGQAWNHEFYWNCTASRGEQPGGRIKHAIEASFGGLEEFKAAFAKAAIAQFGSGWAWLVKGKNGKLKIATTANADTPLARGEVPLLAADLWEHAYYLDYQNRRPDYVGIFLDKLVNWPFAESNLA